MLPELAQTIPQSMLNRPGRALYSGRQAFAGPAPLYIIDYHPGGNPEQFPETVAEQIDRLLNREPADWSAHRDESWEVLSPGRPQGERLIHLLDQLGLNPGEVPAGLLIFPRWASASQPTAAVKSQWAEECWPFHQAVLDRLGAPVVVCLSSYTSDWVLKKERQRTGEKPQLLHLPELRGAWSLSSHAYQSGDRYILDLAHPSRSDWTSPDLDPTPLLQWALSQVQTG